MITLVRILADRARVFFSGDWTVSIAGGCDNTRIIIRKKKRLSIHSRNLNLYIIIDLTGYIFFRSVRTRKRSTPRSYLQKKPDNDNRCATDDDSNIIIVKTFISYIFRTG